MNFLLVGQLCALAIVLDLGDGEARLAGGFSGLGDDVDLGTLGIGET